MREQHAAHEIEKPKVVNETGVSFRYVTSTPCRDERVECAGWAASGECETNEAYMMSSCAFSCTKCSEGYPNQLRSKAERKSAWWKRQHPKPLDFRKITHDIHGKPLIKPNIESDDPVVQAKAARALATMHRTSAHPSPSPLASPSPAPKPHKTFEEKLDDKYKKNTFGFDVHVLACSALFSFANCFS